MKNMNLHDKFERFEQVKMRQAAALISQNIGFSTASTSAISSLSYLLRIYFERLCRDTTECASHAGDDYIALEDVSTVFDINNINLTELHDYIRQVNSFSLPEELPLFPVPANSLDANDGALTINEAENSNEKLLATAEIENGGEIHQQQQETNNDLDQRVNLRIVQKTFPSFTGSFAPDLGFTVRKIIPPTVEISTNLDFTKNHVQCDASFKIVEHDSAVVPTFSAKAVPQDERHKEKKRKKKEKRKQKEELKKEKELLKQQKDENREELEEVHQIEGNQVQEPTGPELEEQPLKIPKIKIRIGPSPEPLIAHTTVGPLSAAANQTAQTAKISSETLPHDHISEKDELLSKSMPIQTDGEHLPVLQEQIKTLSHPAQTQTPLLVPPLRIKSPEKSIPQKKIPIDEANTSKAFEHENRVITQQMQTYDTVEPPINNSESDGQPQTPLPISSKDLAKSSGKKRSRKSEKPSRVDPEMLASLEPSPPQIPAAPSRAMESVLRKSMTPTPAISEQPDKIEIQLKTKKVHEEEPNIASLTAAEFTLKKVKPKSKTAAKKAQANSVPVSSTTPSAEQQGSAAEEEQEEDIWICPVCSVAYVDNGPDMVACDGCDRWFHWGCVGILIPPPENAPWFCAECKKKRKKQQGAGSGSNGNGGSTSRKSSFGAPPTKKRKPSK